MILSKRNLLRHLSNVIGWSTSRKIVVIESDDWGSERFPDAATIENFKRAGYPINNCGFSSFDTLETNEDIECFLNLLDKVRNKFGKVVKVTLLCNTANPYISEIDISSLEGYKSLALKDRIVGDKLRENIILLQKKGRKLGFFDMQYHGREHIYPRRWMRDLIDGNKDTLYAFQHGVWGISPSYVKSIKRKYRSSYDLDIPEDLNEHESSLLQGLEEFQRAFEYNASYFVAPNGPFHKSLEFVLKQNDLKYIGYQKLHDMPLGYGKSRRNIHWLGKRQKSGMYTITRNVIFEPLSTIAGNVNLALQDIESAFLFNKPAVISTHRANYVGNISENNRINGLKKLEQLIEGIITRWPEVIFLTSVQLGEVISKQKNLNEFVK